MEVTPTLRTLLIDDESDSQEVLKVMLKKGCPSVEIVGQCNSVNDAIVEIQRLKPNLILLDIEMPGKDGFEVIRAFDNPDFKVIVVSGYEEYALKAIKLAALDYVLKPIDFNELKTAIKKAENSLKFDDERISYFNSAIKSSGQLQKIVIPTLKGFHTISFENIEVVEAKPGNYCLFKLKDGALDLVTKPLNYFEEILPFPNFYRVHRSHIINLAKIANYDIKHGIITLENGEHIEVATRRRGDFQQKYKEFST